MIVATAAASTSVASVELWCGECGAATLCSASTRRRIVLYSKTMTYATTCGRMPGVTVRPVCAVQKG